MNKEFHTTNEESTIIEVAKTMAEKHSDYLLVLKDGRPVGIITDNDLVTKVLAKEVNSSIVKVKDIMSTPLITIGPDEDLLEASKLMQENNIRKLPVVYSGIIYGIITAKDIANKCGTYVDKQVKDIIRWTAPWGL